jgi:hypothetical protein
MAVYNPIWIFGHTHYRTTFRVSGFNGDNSLLLTSNPVGIRNPVNNITLDKVL